jgi:hypothetical protein
MDSTWPASVGLRAWFALQPFYGIVEASREPDAHRVWADTQAFCNFGLRIPFEPPTADSSGIGIHQLEQLFENEAIVYLFRVGEDAPRIREIFQKEDPPTVSASSCARCVYRPTVCRQT